MTDTPGAPHAWRVWGAVLTVQVAFGSLAVAGKLAFVALPPNAVAVLRIAAALAVIVALERALVPRPAPRVTWRDRAAFALFGFLGVAANQALYLGGLSRTTAVSATLIITTIPAFTLLVALAARSEKWSWTRGLGVGIAIAGVAVLVRADASAFGTRHLVGNLMIVLNSFSYSLYLVASRPYLRRFDPLTVLAHTMLWGMVFLLVPGVPALAAVDVTAVPALAWGALAWLVLVGTVVTYGLSNWLLRHLEASQVAAFIPLQPFVAAALAIAFLGEAVTLRVVGAGAVILVGVVIAARAGRSRRAARPV